MKNKNQTIILALIVVVLSVFVFYLTNRGNSFQKKNEEIVVKQETESPISAISDNQNKDNQFISRFNAKLDEVKKLARDFKKKKNYFLNHPSKTLIEDSTSNSEGVSIIKIPEESEKALYFIGYDQQQSLVYAKKVFRNGDGFDIQYYKDRSLAYSEFKKRGKIIDGWVFGINNSKYEEGFCMLIKDNKIENYIKIDGDGNYNILSDKIGTLLEGDLPMLNAITTYDYLYS